MYMFHIETCLNKLDAHQDVCFWLFIFELRFLEQVKYISTTYALDFRFRF